MTIHTVLAPQLGEGLKEVKVIQFLKNIGEYIEKDAPLIVVETEKATMEIESPISGQIKDINILVNEKVAVGFPILTIDASISTAQKRSTQAAHSNTNLPAQHIHKHRFDEDRLSDRQRVLIKNMHLSLSQVIPAVVTSSIPSEPIQIWRKSFRNSNLPVPSLTEIVSWCVLKTMQKHKKFRSTLLNDGITLKIATQASIAVAVGLPNDELTTMRIAADEYEDMQSFMQLYKERLADTRSGGDHVGPHTVSISDMTSYHVELAVPVVVNPAIATLCIGKKDNATYVLSLCFDHRIINGVGAAQFINDFNKYICNLQNTHTDGNICISDRAVA